jgi:pimeloyl-ACP methyl ester carboxylesterase
MLGRFGSGTMLQSMLGDFYQPTPAILESFAPRYLEQMKYHGFKRAILSSLRTGMLAEDLDLFRRLGGLDKQVLLVWGRHDRTVPFHYSDAFRQFVPHAVFHAIEEAGHIPHFERPEKVNPLLIEFLK